MSDPKDEYKIACNVLLDLEQLVRRSDGWEDSAVEAVHNAVQTAIKCIHERSHGEWIPVKTRELTDEEKEKYPDLTFMWDCPLPDDFQNVLVSTKWGDVQLCMFYRDDDDMDSHFDGFDWGKDLVLAWKPLPEPYKKEGAENE